MLSRVVRIFCRGSRTESLAGPEQLALDDADMAFHRREYERLCGELEDAHRASRLPDVPTSDGINKEIPAVMEDGKEAFRLRKDMYGF
jgi:hypothetical protein